MQGARDAAMNDIEKWLRSLDSPPTENEFISKLHEVLGDRYGKINAAEIGTVVKEMYSAFKIADLPSGAEVVFGGADIRTIDFLSSLDNFYLSKFVQNPDVVSQLNDLIKNLYSEEGIGIFGRGPEGIEEIRNFLSQKLIDLQDYQIQRIVDTAVERARNWAHISQMNDIGVTELVVYEPTKGCPFCAAIDGAVIGVEKAYSNMLEMTKMSPEDYETYLRDENNSPALQNMQSFVDAGKLPPYHPHCHGKIIKRVRG